MKKIYLILFLAIVSINLNAQLNLTKTAYQPVVGDVVNLNEYDTTTAVPKSTGANQSWNFSSFTAGSYSETTTYTTVASTPAGSLFPTANIAAIRGSSDYEYYNNATGSISYVGMANASNTTVTTFTNNATMLNWPTAYGNSNSDVFAAVEVGPTSTVNWNGVISYTASGNGTVILPNGNTHNNCLQVKTIITLTMSGSNSATMTMINYEYYSNAMRYPILTMEYQSFASGTVTNKGFDAKVNVAALTSGVNEQSLNSNDIVIYPNPTINFINVELPGNVLADKIELYDVNGKLVLSTTENNILQTSTLNKGIYFIKVNAKNSVIHKRIIITE